MMRYHAGKFDCDPCALKPACCPNAPARKILRSIPEGARDTTIGTPRDARASALLAFRGQQPFSHLEGRQGREAIA